MNQNDPVRDAEPPPQLPAAPDGARRQLQTPKLHWWPLALIPVFWAVMYSFGIAVLIVVLVVVALIAVSHVALTRRGLDGEKIVGGIIGALGGFAGVVTLLNFQFPSSVLWMSRIVCDSSYHVAYDISHYSLRPGESSSSVDYACVSGENAYDINDFTVWGLQALGIALVLCPIAVVGFLIWRRMRKRD
jgi:hypothetical protein